MGGKRKKNKHVSQNIREAKEPESTGKGRRTVPGATQKERPVILLVVLAIITLAVVARLAGEAPRMIRAFRAAPEPTAAPYRAAESQALFEDIPGMPLQAIQAERRIIDVHEHIGTLAEAPIYLDIMDELGIGKMCLMGSSRFTLTLNEGFGFTEYDQNNEELLKIVEAYPGRFEAWVTVDPRDPGKLDKFKDFVRRGATGLKLYSGHGYVTKKNTYMFHELAMDDPGMLPVYAYCEEHFIPVCIHVNPYKGKPGFAEEFVAVLTQFPDMKVDCPHFMLSSIQSSRLREFLDTFPNLYTDVSFGDFFVKPGLTRISKNPPKFRQIFADYPDRIMYASDLVLIKGPRQTRAWVREQLQSYLDMLTQETYTTTAIPGQTLQGLALPDYIVERVLFKNYEEFTAKRPRGTEITREIDWSRMNVTPLKREPGQAFPPLPKKNSG